ncbi:uncharacterized protein PAC_18511 [Phialocephala subalpina]|uniref:Protein kinase domain-containing protein n=1 Tax=Phialocephala subalpina TaxID=576137 RepID=A0A1L7XUA9_9HELO|nr:uncharacterized protein PAC_18511 [Phialocephala subalpina]
MEFEADPKDTASLKHLAQACERHLREVLRGEEVQEDIVKAREGHWASRQFAEFNLWCAKVGVSGEGLKSIDLRLKDVPEICELLRKLLQSLERDLNGWQPLCPLDLQSMRLTMTQPTEAPAQIKSADSGVDDDTESDASSLSFPSLSSSEHAEAESAADDAASAWKKRNLALRRHIEDTIDRLHGHALRITRAGAKHRRERLEKYRQKEGPKVLYEGFKELGIRTAKMQFPSASEAFRERMAESFARRRIRFEYLEKHQKKRAVDRDVQDEQGLPPEGGDGLAQLLQKQEPPKRLNIPVRRLLQDQRTIYSATENTKLEMRPLPRREERVESVASIALRHPGFPPRPRSSGASFQCPYCRLEFRAREADEDRWSQHVMQDFEPYFCTWEGCTTPFDVPNTFDGLLAHLQDHLEERYHVDMPDGEHKEFNEKEFEEHVARHGKVSNEMLVTMKEASQRKGAFLFESCPFCGGYPDVLEKLDPDTPEAQKELRRHIKQHMQDIALFLPPHREDTVNEDDEFKSSIVTRRSVGHSDLGVPDDFITVCGREGCDCKDKGKHSDEDVSADSPVPEQEVDFWAERFPQSSLYDRSSVTDEYYLSDERLQPFIARFWSTPSSKPYSITREIEESDVELMEKSQASTSHDSQKPMTPTLSLYEELNERICICPITGNKYISNLETLPETVTWPTVKKLLASSFVRRWLPGRDKNLKTKIQGARKVIAILVLIGRSNAIERLLPEDLTDEDLPLSLNGTYLQSHSRQKIFLSFSTWEPGAVGMFLEKQWVILEPPLKLDATTPVDLQLHSRCALSLAFYSCVEVTKTISRPAHVYKGTLKPGFQHGFDNSANAGNPDPIYVAIKTFERISNYINERDMLDRIRSKGIKNDHLIRHLAICDEVPCIIFPWATGGDLGDFWQRKFLKVPGDFLWSLRQIVGLAHALKDLHTANCRHGDLKPANILYFIKNGFGILKIADLDVARAHNHATKMRAGVTITAANTKIYEGPEVRSDMPRSRRYDCWGMGCIILEFVLWLLYDFKALESFVSARNSEWHGYYRPKPQSITVFQDADLSEAAEVHPVVYEAMDFLRKDPRSWGTALEAVVNLVDNHLLQINPEDRIDAAGLHQQLQAILEKVEKHPSYLVNANKPPPSIPPIFSQPPLQLLADLKSTFEQTC